MKQNENGKYEALINSCNKTDSSKLPTSSALGTSSRSFQRTKLPLPPASSSDGAETELQTWQNDCVH